MKINFTDSIILDDHFDKEESYFQINKIYEFVNDIERSNFKDIINECVQRIRK